MKTYIGIFRMRLIAGFQYRAAAWAGVATQFFFGFVFISIYKAFYDSAVSVPEMPIEQLVSYLWMQQAFLIMISLWAQDNSIFEAIRSGNIAYELTRPVSLYWMWTMRLIAIRLSSALMRCLPILAVAFFLPKPYNMLPPPSVETGLLFVISMPLGMLVTVGISMFLFLGAMRLLDAGGIRLILNIVMEFFSGQLIVLPLMPEWLQRIAYCLPFRYTTDVPLRIYSGNIPTAEAYMSIGLQLLWVVVLVALGQMMMRRNLSRVVVQGG